MSGPVGVSLARWVAAFPIDLAPDVAAAVCRAGAGPVAEPTDSSCSPGSIDSEAHPMGLVVDGEVVEIPYRYYGDALSPAESPADLSQRQRTVLGCVFTRHHDGFVRQRWARRVVQVVEPWVVPFMLQLVGEYVIEIIEDLHQDLSELDDPRSEASTVYRRVLLDNPGSWHSRGNASRATGTSVPAKAAGTCSGRMQRCR